MLLRLAGPATLLGLTLLAPAAHAQFGIGPRLGLNVATMRVPSANTVRPIAAWQAGVEAQWKWGALALRPSLLLSQQGARYQIAEEQNVGAPPTPYTYRATRTTRLNYLNLALQLACAPEWARHAQVFTGPYVALGVGGSVKEEPASGFPYRSQAIFNPFRGGPTAQFYDTGWNLGLGYQRGRCLWQLQQSWGLTDLDLAGFRNERRFHRVTSLSLTYLFSRRAEFLPAE